MHTVIHSDMNSFYASVEVLYNPRLQGKPVAVCGSVEDRHGIILAKSYQAKAYGIKTGETVAEALAKCPPLLLVEPHYDWYAYYSSLAKQIYQEYTPAVEAFGLDECWLDLGELSPLEAWKRAEEIRRKIEEELGLNVSMGISYTKTYAKIGSDLAPRAGKLLLPPEQAKAILSPLPVSVISGVGRQTARLLQQHGISTVGQLAAMTELSMQQLLGKVGVALRAKARGEEVEHVIPIDTPHQPKSLGRGITCSVDLHQEDQLSAVLLWLAQRVSKGLKEEGLEAGNIHLGWRRAKTLEHGSIQQRLDRPEYRVKSLWQLGLKLFEQAGSPYPLRSVTLYASNLIKPEAHRQLYIRNEAHLKDLARIQMIDATVEQVRSKFGSNALEYASLISPEMLPHHRTDVCTLPSKRKDWGEFRRI